MTHLPPVYYESEQAEQQECREELEVVEYIFHKRRCHFQHGGGALGLIALKADLVTLRCKEPTERPERTSDERDPSQPPECVAVRRAPCAATLGCRYKARARAGTPGAIGDRVRMRFL